MHIKNKLKIILTLLTMAVMFILMPRAIFAAMGTISGTVTDGTNPVSEVSISVATFDEGHMDSVASSVYGTYSFSNIPVGTGYKMYFNKAGYKEVLKSNVEVKDEETTTVDAVLTASPVPTIRSAVVSADNRYITIIFSEGVWGDNRHLNPVTVDDFNFCFDRNEGTVTSATLTELKTTADTALSGGETSIRFYLNLTGGPASGVETVIITARADSVYNKDGTAISAYQTTGYKKLYDKAPPKFYKDYPKPGDPHCAGSKRVSLKIKPHDETVKAYYVVVSNEANAPNTNQVMNGKDSSGDDALAWGNHDIGKNGLGIKSIAPLPADDTDYDAYIVIVDTVGNATVPVRVDVRTPIKLLAQDYPKVGETQAAGSQKVEILNKANGKTTAYYVAVAEDAPAPSREQIVAGQNNVGGAALASGSVSLDANEEKSSVTAALGADSTPYDVYVVLYHMYVDIHRINYGEIYSEVVKLDVITPPAVPDPPTLQSAIVNANGDVELTFDKVMTDPADSAGGFLICRDDGISRTVTTSKLKTGDTKTIELILTSKISGGEVFYVSYIPMADRKVEAAGGGVLAGFSPHLIENNLPHPILKIDHPPTGTAGTQYSYTFTATGGTGSYSFSLNDGCLPSGLVLNNNTGVLSGTPTTTGRYTFTIMAIDGNSAIDKHDYTLIINEASDTTPPAFAERFPKAGATQVEGSRRVSLLVNPLETVDVYYVIVENGAATPTTGEVMSGTGSGGSAAIKKGSFTSVNTEGIDISIILSDHNTDYDAYVLITDDVGNPTLGGPVQLRTPEPANIFVEGYPNVGDAQSAGSKKIEIVVKTVVDAQVFYVLVSDNGDAPSIDQIVNGKKSEREYYLGAGNIYVTAGCAPERFVTNALPADGTEYDIYVVARDITDSTILSKLEKLDVTTPPAAASNVTTIKVKNGYEVIVTAVDNNTGIESITVANGTTLGILMDAIESTDSSVQAYGLKRRDSYIVDTDEMLLSNDILEVTAGDNLTKKQYAITIAKVPTTFIAISGSGDASSVKKGRTLQMNVAVLPSNATDKTVTWSVENKTGNASISDTGLLTAISVGTVTVKATANDGSGIEANKDITITATSGKTKQTGFFAILATEKGVVPPPVEAGLPVITDISNHWAKGSIEYLIKGGTIVGYPDNTFKPDNPITRAEFTALLVKTFDLTADSGKVFEDTSGHWAKNYISTAAAYGIILGYNDKGFGPDDVITREQMVVMITRAAHLSDVSDTLQFTDSDHISSWAREAISSVTAQQIITGYTDNTFRPGNLATRAEAVTILLRIKDM